MELSKNTILLISFDQQLGKQRKELLEAEGLEVVLVRDTDSAMTACRRHRPRLVMIGYSVPVAERRRIWAAARRLCKVPVVELTAKGVPETAQESFFVYPEPASSFVREIKQIMKLPETRK